jgi:hypothetical protein
VTVTAGSTNRSHAPIPILFSAAGGITTQETVQFAHAFRWDATMRFLRRIVALVFCVTLLFVIVKFGLGIDTEHGVATDAAIAVGIMVVASFAFVIWPMIREARSKK